MADNVNKEKTAEELNELLKIRREKLATLQSMDKDPFHIIKAEATHHSKEIKDNFETLEGQTVSVAGRLMSKRVMGKASFIDVQDRDGHIQCYITRDDVGGAEFYNTIFKKMIDIGDIVSVKGFVFKTKMGEISIHASEIALLSKSLQILPEKYHGLANKDLRYRQRYVDLIVNPDVKQSFIKRSKIVTTIREYLDSQDFLEVETPILQTIPGGATARPFITHHNTLDIDMYLRIALELPLKRLIVGGLEGVYEIGRVFRNEGMDANHNPEFTLLELYQAYTDYYGMMDITEGIIKECCKKVAGIYKITYQGTELDFEKPFERITMIDAVKKYAGVDFDEVKTLEEARALADSRHIEYEPHHLKGDILNLFFEEYVEKNLIQPTFLMDHPIEISPLTKKKYDKEGYVERFELFMVGREFANAYSELNDPIDQRERFKRQEELRGLGDEEANMIDEDFLTALEYGMPPTGGMGMGIDRLVMLFTDAPTIRDVLLFPTMKPLDN
ncbi:MAG: lysine--tRNA ligase [Clostridiales bacterium]|nr:lysine--tRNA ligase [Clostridiales bacterium]